MKRALCTVFLALGLTTNGLESIATDYGMRGAVDTSRRMADPTNRGEEHARLTVASGPVVTNSELIAFKELARQCQERRGSRDQVTLTDQMIEQELLSQEAVQLHLDSDPNVKAELNVGRREVLARAAKRYYVQSHVRTDEDLRQLYETQREIFWPRYYQITDIVVRTKPSAKRVLSQIQLHVPIGSIKDGTVIANSAWFTAQQLPSYLSGVVDHLAANTLVSSPIKTPDGWHIVRLEDIHEQKAAPFEKVKEGVRYYFERQDTDNHVADLRRQSIIKR